MIELQLDRFDSPLGKLLLVVKEDRLCALEFADHDERLQRILNQRFSQVRFRLVSDPCGWSERIQSYFRGDLSALDSIPVDPGGTPFQQQVWLTLRSILPGQVLSYGQLAKRVERPGAFRAVGMANSLNPISIVLPCHRVIGSDRSLTGYAGGLERKRWLLQHEGALLL